MGQRTLVAGLPEQSWNYLLNRVTTAGHPYLSASGQERKPRLLYRIKPCFQLICAQALRLNLDLTVLEKQYGLVVFLLVGGIRGFRLPQIERCPRHLHSWAHR